MIRVRKHGFDVAGKTLEIMQQFHYLYHSLIKKISGLVFLGVPHFKSDRAIAKTTLNLLLKCSTGDSTPIFEEDASMVINVCNRFDDLNLNLPVVSIYETYGTKIPHGILSRLVGKARNPIVSFPFSIPTLG